MKRADKPEADTATIDDVIVRAHDGGEATGPSPVARRNSGTRHTLRVDPSEVPLAIRTAGANASDRAQIIPLVRRFPEVGGTPGRPREVPDDAYADRGYGSEKTRAFLRWLEIGPRFVIRRTPHGSRLGKVRWVVERTN